ncbi:isochorismatase family cysteine hydrolase [Pelagicoccus sp. SDUM812003]|uniref:cysteine hydrolase family protein n=1 Tax=Pelagicoccus sp. SDUM812003 TaxID=3041267 RepID=UPI00280C66DD|nr:isochorismatase family cysteine hydrolase [Pelagicoccus sp. SDUM812003]MDQ8202903.1 cysteine hydrolase [Pelagicoccus sp. SDUM812003]
MHEDPLKTVYHESIVDNPGHFSQLINHNTALLCIDLQYLDAVEGYGVFRDPETSGVPKEGRDYYFSRLQNTVLPNVRKLQEAFRENHLEVAHTRIQALTRDGRDRSAGHKRLNLLAAPGSQEAKFVESVAPAGDEVVVNKTASGVFSSTNFNYVLANMGINALFVCGVYTNECVETTVRAASDLGFFVTMIDDACATVTPELHQASIATLKDRYARVITTEEALEDIERFVHGQNVFERSQG